jgi:hypothetical protein
VFEVLEQEIINCLEDSSDEEDDTYATKLRHITQSELHKKAARPRLISYNDTISWVLENIDVQTRSIISHQNIVIGSFRPEHLQVMYKLSPNPKYTYNATFILEFEQRECVQYARSGHDIIKTWWGHPEKFRTDSHGLYATRSLDAHMIYVAMMLCRLFGKKGPTHFLVEWVPIMNEVAKGYTFNWDKLLSNNLAKEIVDYKTTKSKGKNAPFYMSAYIMDAICFMTPFPLMNWS